MITANGPPIRTRFTDLDNGLRVRSAFGDAMRRHDVHGGDGWHDFMWEDLSTSPPKAFNLVNRNNQTVVAPLGVSQWSGNGPAVPAERGCSECHKTIAPAFSSDPALPNATLVTLASMEWPRLRPDKPKATSTSVVSQQVGPPGPRGPDGPAGVDGKDGKDGKDVDPSVVTSSIKEWLSEHISELRPTDAQVQHAVDAWLAAHLNEIRGKNGTITIVNEHWLVKPDGSRSLTSTKEHPNLKSGVRFVNKTFESDLPPKKTSQ